MKTKRIIALISVLVLMLSLCTMQVFADAESAKVYVTVFDGSEVQLVWEEITVSDTDGDGALTVNDALFAAHEAKYDGGAAAGYASSATEYGISLNKLWGNENGGSLGYCVNNASAMSLSDPVKDGDLVYAYAYTDLAAWSDMYTYFDVTSVEAKKGDEITLTLSGAGFDADWNPVTLPIEGAKITVDGKDTGVVTDAQGKAVIALDDTGVQIISALSDNAVIVPPVCSAEVYSKGVHPAVPAAAAAVILLCTAAAFGIRSRKKNA